MCALAHLRRKSWYWRVFGFVLKKNSRIFPVIREGSPSRSSVRGSQCAHCDSYTSRDNWHVKHHQWSYTHMHRFDEVITFHMLGVLTMPKTDIEGHTYKHAILCSHPYYIDRRDWAACRDAGNMRVIGYCRVPDWRQHFARVARLWPWPNRRRLGMDLGIHVRRREIIASTGRTLQA